MAKKKTIISKRIKTHGAHIKAQIVREKWADIRKSFSGKAIEIPLKPILKKVTQEFGPMLPEAKLKPLFDVEKNDNNANEDSIAFEERVNDVCTIHTTDENWAKRYYFNMDKAVGTKYTSLENRSVKIVKWDLNANTTHSFANYGVAGTTRGSRDRSRIRNLMLTLCEKFTLLYDKKFKEHDIVHYRNHMDKRMKWKYFVAYGKSCSYDGVNERSNHIANVNRLFYLKESLTSLIH